MSAVPRIDFKLRPYQQGCADEAHAHMDAGRDPLILAPTGAGKTLIASVGLIRPIYERGGTILFVAPWTPLIEQTSRKLDQIGIEHGIVWGNHWRARYASPVQVASRDTLINRRESLPRKFDLIIADEAHHCAEGNRFSQIMEHWSDARKAGLTATACRLDGKPLRKCFNAIVKAPSIAALIEMRFLKPPRAIYPPRSLKTEGLRKSGGDWNRSDLAHAIVKQKLVGDMIAEWKRHADGRPTIGFAANIDSSKHYVEMFNAAGIPSAHVDQGTSQDERDRILRDFRAGKYLVLWNVQIFTEGFDCPSVSCIILARLTESESLYIQMGGRGLRPANEIAVDGEDCVVIDMVGMTHRHGRLTDPRDWSLEDGIVKSSSSPAVKACPNCGTVPPPAAPICPSCGFTMREADGESEDMFRTPTIYVGDGTRLVPDDGTAAQAPPVEGTPERCGFFKSIAEKAHRDGWKPVAVNMAFQRRFKSFPKWADQATSLVKVVYDKQAGEWTYRVAELDQTEMEIPA